MNLVKKSLYLCIGSLLLMLALQGTQSLWQISRIAGSTDAVVQSTRLSAEARQLWTTFLETEEAFRKVTGFTDAAAAWMCEPGTSWGIAPGWSGTSTGGTIAPSDLTVCVGIYVLLTC